MAELMLSRDERLRLKSESHHLEAVVLIGANGLTEAVMKEIDRALTAHELVKVRTPALAREEREQMFGQVADHLGAARVQLIGRLMVLFRPAPEDEHPHPRASRAASPASGRGNRKARSLPSRSNQPSTLAGGGRGRARSLPSRSNQPSTLAGGARGRARSLPSRSDQPSTLAGGGKGRKRDEHSHPRASRAASPASGRGNRKARSLPSRSNQLSTLARGAKGRKRAGGGGRKGQT
ncbi:MAG TPA: YhbY family RNA-binding protein [Burkholderiaceae bacterium]|nr:YhbY family RNA-binding protein [Burkholderiaceae bacterium]